MDIDIRINKPKPSNPASKFHSSSLTPMTEANYLNEVDSNDPSNSKGHKIHSRVPAFKFPETQNGVDTTDMSEATRTFYNNQSPDQLLENRQPSGVNSLSQSQTQTQQHHDKNQKELSSSSVRKMSVNMNQILHDNYHIVAKPFKNNTRLPNDFFPIQQKTAHNPLFPDDQNTFSKKYQRAQSNSREVMENFVNRNVAVQSNGYNYKQNQMNSDQSFFLNNEVAQKGMVPFNQMLHQPSGSAAQSREQSSVKISQRSRHSSQFSTDCQKVLDSKSLNQSLGGNNRDFQMMIQKHQKTGTQIGSYEMAEDVNHILNSDYRIRKNLMKKKKKQDSLSKSVHLESFRNKNSASTSPSQNYNQFLGINENPQTLYPAHDQQTSYLFRNKKPSAKKDKALLMSYMRDMQKNGKVAKPYVIDSKDSSYQSTQKYFGMKDNLRQSMAMPPGASRLLVDSGIIKGAHYVTSDNFNQRAQSQMQMGQDTFYPDEKSQIENDYGDTSITFQQNGPPESKKDIHIIDFEKTFKFNNNSVSFSKDSKILSSPVKTSRRMQDLKTESHMSHDQSSFAPQEDSSNNMASTNRSSQFRMKEISFKNMSNAMLKRLEASQNMFQVQQKTKEDYKLSEYEDYQKIQYLNLQQEYEFHQKCMGQLCENQKQMQMSFDYTFFRNVVGPFVDKEKLIQIQSQMPSQSDLNQMDERQMTEFLEKEIGQTQTISLGSSSNFEMAPGQIDPRQKTFLSAEMVKAIPKQQVSMVQNKKLVAIWLESKQQMQQMMDDYQKMTTKCELRSTEPKQQIKFLVDCSRLMERFIKVMCQEEENIMAGMFIDQLFKTIIVKSSNTERIKDKYLEKKLQEMKDKIKEYKLDCKDKIAQNNNLLDQKRLQIEEEQTSLKNLVKSQKQQIDQLQSVLDDRNYEIQQLTTRDDREQTVKDLQSRFQDMQDMINEHSTFHGKQVRLMSEYTSMIDIGIAKIPREEQGLQTDLALVGCDVMDDSKMLQMTLQPISAVSMIKGKLDIGIHQEKIPEFKDIFIFCENILDGKAFKILNIDQKDTALLKKNGIIPYDKLIHPSQPPSFQLQIFNIFYSERQNLISSSGHDINSIRQQSINFIKNLKYLQTKNILYSFSMSQLLGITFLDFYPQTVNLYMHFRNLYIQFYEKEQDEFKIVLALKSGSPLLKSKKKRSKTVSVKKSQEKKVYNNKDEVVVEDTKEEGFEEECEKNEQEELGEEAEEQDEEYFGQILHLSRVLEFVKSSFKPQLGQVVSQKVLESMQSQYTKNMPKMQSCAIEAIYTAEHMPVVRNVGRNETGSPTTKKQDSSHNLTVDLKPKDSFEKQEMINKVNAMMEPQFFQEFSKVMASLLFQSNQKPQEILASLKQYDLSHKIGLDNFNPSQFLQALSTDNKFQISLKEVDLIFQFLNPFGFKSKIQDQNQMSYSRHDSLDSQANSESDQKGQDLDQDQDFISDTNSFQYKAFIDLFNELSMTQFSRIAYVSTPSVYYAILDGIRDCLKLQSINLSLAIKNLMIKTITSSTPHSKEKKTPKSRKTINQGFLDHSTLMDSSHLALQKQNTISKFSHLQHSPLQVMTSIQNFESVVSTIFSKQDMSLSQQQKMDAYKNFIIEVNCKGDKEFENNEERCCQSLANKLMEVQDDLIGVCNLNFCQFH